MEIGRSPFFRVLHEYGKVNPNEVYNLFNHIYAALDLDLWPLAEQYGVWLQRLYPDQGDTTYPSVRDYYIFRGETRNLQEWIKYWYAEKGLDSLTWVWDTIELNIHLGNYDKAKNLFEETFPEWTNPKIQTQTPTAKNIGESVY